MSATSGAQCANTTEVTTRTYPGASGPTFGWALAQCASCKRVLKPKKDGTVRPHQVRNRNTRSLDATRDILWDAAGRN